MTSNNMRSVVTFTFFSFLLLSVSMFFLFYRYDVSYGESGTLIRIGFTVRDNDDNLFKVNGLKSRETTHHDIHRTIVREDENPRKNATNHYSQPEPEKISTIPVSNTFVAILSSNTRQSTASIDSPSNVVDAMTQTFNKAEVDEKIAQHISDETTATPRKRKPTRFTKKTTPKASKYEDSNIKANPTTSETSNSYPIDTLLNPLQDMFDSILTEGTQFRFTPDRQADNQDSPTKPMKRKEPSKNWEPFLFPSTYFVDKPGKDAKHSDPSISLIPEFEILPKPQPETKSTAFLPKLDESSLLLDIEGDSPFEDSLEKMLAEEAEQFFDFQNRRDSDSDEPLIHWIFS